MEGTIIVGKHGVIRVSNRGAWRESKVNSAISDGERGAR